MEVLVLEELIAELMEELKIELKDEQGEPDEAILKVKLKNAIREVKSARGYLPSHDADFILNDLQNYIANIKDLTIYDYNQIGAEGESSHDENGTGRTWKNRNSCFSGIVKFVQLF